MAWLATSVSWAAIGGSRFSSDLPHSAIALMPEGEPASPEVLRPLRAQVVAWGNDAVSHLDAPEKLHERMKAYRDIGVDWLACNVWMLTPTRRVLHDDPRFQEAVCRDIEGQGIVPRWLDGEYRGVREFWGCTNHPLFREQLVARARAGIEAGANLLHLDDHMGTAAAAEHSGGCFCDYCMAGFAAWLRMNWSSAELAQNEITDPAHFDYRGRLRRDGVDSRANYEAALREKRVPLREAFLRFQREAAAAFVAELRDVAAATAGRAIPVGVNAWNLAPTQLATAHEADYFANELRHYGVEQLEPPRAYLLADALVKRVFSTGTGEDWIEVMEHGDVARVQRWIALAHSFGHHFMFAHRKWAFSSETGTRWYETPLSTYAPICEFITNHPELFDDYRPVRQVGVLYDNRAQRTGRTSVNEILRDLHGGGYSTGLVVAGDEWLRHTLSAAELEQFEIVVIPPGVELDDEQTRALEVRRAKGGVVEWQGLTSLREVAPSWIELPNDSGVWALPRVRVVDGQRKLVIHVLNQKMTADGKDMVATGALRLRIESHLLPSTAARRATLFAPGQPATELSLSRDDHGWSVEFPSVDLWAVLHVE